MEGGRSKNPLSLRPVRRARGDNRRTLVIKDGWTSYHVQETSKKYRNLNNAMWIVSYSGYGNSYKDAD
ncbi:unnamed protein product [Larinioides sclopetarius]|uniref:Uncharacterized protein n=1 Tax=Larinioides sclopetarius TaxID=280406 RepID=A0AAV2BHS6_9ARAC